MKWIFDGGCSLIQFNRRYGSIIYYNLAKILKSKVLTVKSTNS